MSFLAPDELQSQLTNINDDRRGATVAGAIICGVMSYVFVTLRMIAKKKSKTRLHPDDWAILVALLFGSVQFVDCSIGVIWGLGRHMILLTQPVNFGKNLIAAELMYVFAIAAVKISILLLWNRLFTSKRFRIGIWIVGTLVVLMSVAAILVVALQCIPIEHLWNPYVPANCLNMGLAVTIFGALNLLTDILIILLPIKQLMQLRLQKREQLQLYGLFLTGGLVTIISAARMYYTMKMGSQDVTWTYVDAGIWSSAEISAAIVSACLPTLRPLFSKRRNEVTGSIRESYPSIGRSNIRSDMYQLARDDDLPLKNGMKGSGLAKPAMVWTAPVWKDDI